MLRRYKSGKLPKAFKMLPGLSSWEDYLYLTRPEEWSPHAVYAATRIFASNLNAAMAQRYAPNQRLHTHALPLPPELKQHPPTSESEMVFFPCDCMGCPNLKRCTGSLPLCCCPRSVTTSGPPSD
jgi:hypothetical protein